MLTQNKLLQSTIKAYIFGIHCANGYEFIFMCQYFKCAQEPKEYQRNVFVKYIQTQTQAHIHEVNISTESKETALNTAIYI